MDLRSLVTATAQLLEVPFESEAHAYFFNVGVAEAEEEEDDDRTQLVTVELDDEGEILLVSTEVGAFDEDFELAEVLRTMRDAIFSRVYVTEATADEPEQLVVEAALVARAVDAELLASVVQEVAELADELELLLFDEPDDDAEDLEDD
jgi:hypothetical protein